MDFIRFLPLFMPFKMLYGIIILKFFYSVPLADSIFYLNAVPHVK